MPQIWPMNWVLLFLFFILTFLIFLSVFYFNIVPETGSKSEEHFTSPHSLNWKW